jgi:spore maturation protein CgeB
VVLFVSAFYMPPGYMDMIRARPSTKSGQKMRVVILHTESPYQDDEQLERAAHADLNLLNDPMNLQAFRDLGVPAHYMPHAYRPAIHNPGLGLEEFDTDLAFIGTGFPSRIEFFERMLASGHIDDLDITLGGNWQAIAEGSVLSKHMGHELTECVRNDTTALIYRSAKCGINFYRREGGHQDVIGGKKAALAHQGLAVGPREIEMAACGLFFLRDPRPESDELFPMLPVFDSPEDAAEKTAWWVKHEDERQEAAMAARAAIRDRTFLANARRLTQYLES